MVFEGKDIVKTGRTMIGATNPLASAPGTIRADFGVDVSMLLQATRACLLVRSTHLPLLNPAQPGSKVLSVLGTV